MEPLTLESTIDQMLSADYKDRFQAEVKQLRIRLTKLRIMINEWDNGELDFTPTCPRSMYDEQIDAMEKYMDILIKRAELEGIHL